MGKRKCEHGTNHFILKCSVFGEVSRRWSCCTAACGCLGVPCILPF